METRNGCLVSMTFARALACYSVTKANGKTPWLGAESYLHGGIAVAGDSLLCPSPAQILWA